MNKLGPKLIEELLRDYEKPEDIIGEDGFLKQVGESGCAHRHTCTACCRLTTFRRSSIAGIVSLISLKIRMNRTIWHRPIASLSLPTRYIKGSKRGTGILNG